MVAATTVLEVCKIDLNPYPYISSWYTMYRKENPELWAVVEKGRNNLIESMKRSNETA